MPCIFCVYVFGIWATLYAAWLIAFRCLEIGSPLRLSRRPRSLQTARLRAHRCCWSIRMSPQEYLNPLGLLAIAGALDIIAAVQASGHIRIRSSGWRRRALLTAVMHPLMASYAACCVALLVCASYNESSLRIFIRGILLFAFVWQRVVNLLAPASAAGICSHSPLP